MAWDQEVPPEEDEAEETDGEDEGEVEGFLYEEAEDLSEELEGEGEPQTPAVAPAVAPAGPPPAEAVQLAGLLRRAHSGAGWFYLIAGLSLLNSVLCQAGTSFMFIFGLGMTLPVDVVTRGMAGEWGPFVIVIGLALSALVAAMFVGIGLLARKGYTLAFVVGVLLYAADALLLVLIQYWLEVGFHILALAFLISGLVATVKLRAMLRRPAENPAQAGAEG